MNNPCFNCTERKSGCHGKCDRYRKAKQEYEAEKSKRLQAKKEQTDFEEVRWGKA